MKFHLRVAILTFCCCVILLALANHLIRTKAANTDVQVAVPAAAFALIPIHDIQGSNTQSPFAGQTVSATGIVTAVRSNGFFLQAADAEIDDNPNTSEAILVFTGTASPAAVRGNRVTVTGVITEFRPTNDPASPPITEFANNPTVELVSTGNPLPLPVVLQASDTPANGSLEQLERFEAMRVTIPALTVIAPTGGNVTETTATATSNGLFFGVIAGVARPFREPGIELPNALPPGAPLNVPRFDANPERLRVDSDAQIGASALEVVAGQTITNLTGVLDYGQRSYTLLPDPTNTNRQVSGNDKAIPVPSSAADEFTVAAFNLQRFFDTTDDPAVSETVLTAQAFQNRLNKASLALRKVLQTPDILSLEEIENLAVLQTLAQKINADAVAAGQPNPLYAAYLVEGNDVGGIDVGFLVKTALVAPDKPRVSVISVVQAGKTTSLTNPNTSAPSALNDRPPLVLRAVVNHTAERSFPLTVIVNHLRSLNDLDNTTVQGSGTVGGFVRAKRRAQAEFLANLIQARQLADPHERIITVGDYNAYQFNDGFVDLIGTIKGAPTPADQVYAPSADLVTPDLVELLDFLPVEQRYSYVFGGNAQTIDHELITQNLLPYFARLAYARLDADFPESFRNDPNRPERISDHDAAVAFFNFCPRLALQPEALAEARVGQSYSTMFALSGPNNKPLWLLDGVLPRGLTFDSASGVLAGVPQESGVFNFTVQARLDGHCSTSRAYSLIVKQPDDQPYGLPPAANITGAALIPGSVLFFPVYTSSSATPVRQNTRFSLTNTAAVTAAKVHLFFVDGVSGVATDIWICLTANQTVSFLASDIDPDVNGYVAAVATDGRGCPLNFNYLVGEASVKFASGHMANLGAVTVAALSGTLVCDGATAALRFDGVNYSALPRVLALSNFPSRAEGNDTRLIVDRIGGDLTETASSTGTLFGILYDDAETGFSFSLPSARQVRWNITKPFPSPPPRLEQIVPAGRTGWLKLYNLTQDFALLGVFINFNPNVERNSFSQGHNLHALSLTNSATLTIPVFPPTC